jgi:Receptor family ligand binding region
MMTLSWVFVCCLLSLAAPKTGSADGAAIEVREISASAGPRTNYLEVSRRIQEAPAESSVASPGSQSTTVALKDYVSKFHPNYFNWVRSLFASGTNTGLDTTDGSGVTVSYTAPPAQGDPDGDLSSRSAVYRVNIQEGNSDDAGSAEFRLVDLKAYFPFTVGSTDVVRHHAFDDAFAFLLAVYFFNNPTTSPFLSETALTSPTENSTSIRPEEISACNVRLTTKLFNSHFNQRDVTQSFTQVLARTPSFGDYPPTAAVVGAYRSTESLPLAILTSVNAIPLVSASSTAVDLDKRDLYPYFGRTVSTTVVEAHALLKYLLMNEVTHVALVYVTVSASVIWRNVLSMGSPS